MDRDQLAEHLRFAAELGVAGVSRDAAWRQKGDGSQIEAVDSSPKVLKTQVAGGQVEAEKTPVPFFSNPADALAGVKAFIGECTRCKLSGLGRTQVVFGMGNPGA